MTTPANIVAVQIAELHRQNPPFIQAKGNDRYVVGTGMAAIVGKSN
jgi:hypothetical protein